MMTEGSGHNMDIVVPILTFDPSGSTRVIEHRMSMDEIEKKLRNILSKSFEFIRLTGKSRGEITLIINEVDLELIYAYYDFCQKMKHTQIYGSKNYICGMEVKKMSNKGFVFSYE
jgi:hypothetical protein